jgi:hypothetical protein
MYELALLSQARVAYTLPVFPGLTVPAELASGRDTARSCILRHLPDFKFDVQAAEQTMRDIDAWSMRNSDALSALMADPTASSLPAALQLSLGSPDRVRSFLVASFTLAASGLGPWTSGEVDRAVSAGEQSAAWAGLDAESRLQLFGIIVRLDEQGDLGPLLRGEKAMAGFGEPVSGTVVLAVVIATLLFAAMVLTAVYLYRRMELNNRLMREMCNRAQAEGRENVVRDCIEAAKDLQSDTPMSSLGSMLVKVVGAAALIYVGGRYVTPAVIEAFSKRRAKP